jgi:hypothetical protein
MSDWRNLAMPVDTRIPRTLALGVCQGQVVNRFVFYKKHKFLLTKLLSLDMLYLTKTFFTSEKERRS